MNQQNKTESPSIQNELSPQHQSQKQNSQIQIHLIQSRPQQHDESKIQIIVPLGKAHDEQQEQQEPTNVVESEIESELQKTPHMVLKQSGIKHNLHDVSAVCIDLFSDNQTIQRKCTLNSGIHYSRLFAEFKREEKTFTDQGIQTSLPFLNEKPQEKTRIELEKVQNQPQQQVQQIHVQQNEQNKLVKTIEMSEVLAEQKIIFVSDSSQNKTIQKNTEQQTIQLNKQQQVHQAKNELKQTLLQGQSERSLQNQQTAKQVAQNNFQSIPFLSIRNRQITFQQLPDSQIVKQQTVEIQHQQQFLSQEVKIFLLNIKESEYDQVIKQLNDKVVFLELEHQKLLNEANQARNQEEQQVKKAQNHVLQNSPGKSTNHQSKFIIQKTYEILIEQNTKQELPKKIVQNKPIQIQQSSSPKQTQLSKRKSQIVRQFSSGEVSNLLVESQNQLIDLKDLKDHNQYSSPHNHLQKLPVVFSSTLYAQNSTQSLSFGLPILSISQSNLATIKEAYEQLPYDRFRNIMKLDLIVSKISFKEKHFPSNYSTEKQLKLYGKRLLRLLAEPSPQSDHHGLQNNMLTLQNDMEYYKNQQHVVYYLKNNQNFVFVCYFNHTVYIGEYITQGPMQQIIRQGYGIQIRESKYVYQGEFFADKKHGYGFVEFVGKNPFIYCGYFMDGFMDGHGKSMNENGQIYIGDYKLGQRDGVGKLIYSAEKKVYYEGEFYDGFKHGKGYQVFENGDSFTGFYSRDKFQGEGQYKWKNQTIYQGTFVEGYKHGKGLLIFANGKSFEKYYDHNKQINIEDDKKTIKSSRISTITQSRLQEKTMVQQKPWNFKNSRSMSGQSLFSHKSRTKQKPLKVSSKDKKKIAEILKQKQMQEDLKNLDKILKDPAEESKIRKIFSVKKLDTKDKIIGKMYNTTERPSMKISENGQLDLFKLSKMGPQRKSLISFDSEDRLEELKDSTHHRRVQRTTNFSQF